MLGKVPRDLPCLGLRKSLTCTCVMASAAFSAAQLSEQQQVTYCSYQATIWALALMLRLPLYPRAGSHGDPAHPMLCLTSDWHVVLAACMPSCQHFQRRRSQPELRAASPGTCVVLGPGRSADLPSCTTTTDSLVLLPPQLSLPGASRWVHVLTTRYTFVNTLQLLGPDPRLDRQTALKLAQQEAAHVAAAGAAPADAAELDRQTIASITGGNR